MNNPRLFVDSDNNTLIYLHGSINSDDNSYDLKFQYDSQQTITVGEGLNKSPVTGIFNVKAFIPASETLNIPVGTYKLVIRTSESENPTNDDVVDSHFIENVIIEERIDNVPTDVVFEATVPETGE